MVFSSLTFLCIFLPAVLLLYFANRNVTYRNVIITAASLVFYAWGEPVFLILLLAASMINYALAIGIKLNRDNGRGKLFFCAAMIFDIGMLAVFKYTGFLINSFNGIFRLSLPAVQIGLPLGISFYTFQILTYIVDVYRGNAPVQFSYLKFLTFVSMFPQLIAGPIVRYSDVARSLGKREVRLRDFADGAQRFVIGLSKKVYLANFAGEAKDIFLAPYAHPTVLSSWLGIVFYSLQLYFDFSGYSDMAIGMGRILGFRFPQNFDYPYISRSITEFWRRWHMSLGSFFRDYVYIPLGGNRCSRYRWLFNMLVVWLLTGLWHGASWNFVLWGVYYGVLLILEKLLFSRWQKIPVLPHITTLFLVVIGWGLFYYTDFAQLGVFLKHLFGIDCPFWNITVVSVFLSYSILFGVCIICATPLPYLLYSYITSIKYAGWIIEAVVMTALFAGCIALLAGATSNPFLYFRF